MPFSHYISGGIAWLVGNGTWDLRAWHAASVRDVRRSCRGAAGELW